MPHLKHFSSKYHARFEFEPGTRYEQDFIIYDAILDRERQIVIEDLYRPDLNDYFSALPFNLDGVSYGWDISFFPSGLNISEEWATNVSNNVDLTGVGVHPRIFNTRKINSIGQSFTLFNTYDSELGFPERTGKFNLDGYNSYFRWTSVLLSPRHILMCGHCFAGFCNLTEFDYRGAKAVWRNTAFMGKNNRVYKAFNTEEEAIAAAQAGTFRLLRCGGQISPDNCDSCNISQEFILLELPDDGWIDTDQVKYYNKIIKFNSTANNTIVYGIRGSGHVVQKLKFYYAEELPGSFIELTEDEDYINSTRGEVGVGDSFSPVFVNFNGETVLVHAALNEVVYFDDNFFQLVNEFMKSSGYSIIPIVQGIASQDKINYTNISYFNFQEKTFLNDKKYASRFLENERKSNLGIEIAFKPGTMLQASELNEVQDNFCKQYTFSNNILSNAICANLKNNYKIYDNLLFDNSDEAQMRFLTFKKYFFIDLINESINYNGPVAYRDMNSQLLYFNYIGLISRYNRGLNRISIVIDTYVYRASYLSDELSFYLSDYADRISYLDYENERVDMLTNVEYTIVPETRSYVSLGYGEGDDPIRPIYSSTGEYIGNIAIQ
jgi:hypothetical protein